MRVLALDIGEKRIGVAVSDPSGTVAMPLTILDAQRVTADGADLRRLIEEYDAEVVLVGLPLSLDGSEGLQAQRVRRVAKRLGSFIGIPVVFADERLSSTQASRVMGEGGVSSRNQRKELDKIAASIFLQSYLDARRETDRIGES